MNTSRALNRKSITSYFLRACGMPRGRTIFVGFGVWKRRISTVFESMSDFGDNPTPAKPLLLLRQFGNILRRETVSTAADDILVLDDECRQKAGATQCRNRASRGNKNRCEQAGVDRSESPQANPLPPNPVNEGSRNLCRFAPDTSLRICPIAELRFPCAHLFLRFPKCLTMPRGRLELGLILGQIGPKSLHGHQLFGASHFLERKRNWHDPKLALQETKASERLVTVRSMIAAGASERRANCRGT